MGLRAAASLLFLAALGTACNTSYPNPFENAEASPTAIPPPDAALVFTGNGHASQPGGSRELFAVAEEGGTATRLTFCSSTGSCDTSEAAFASDRERVAVRRAAEDTNGDGKLTAEDGEALVYVDLARQVEAILVSADRRVTGVDWSPVEDLLVYSAQGIGGEDLFRTTPIRPTPDNAQQTRNLTCSAVPGTTTPDCDPAIRERRPRIDPTGTVAAFERIDATGKARIFIFQSSSSLVPVTTGGPGSEPLAGTPYVVGSDADPDYSPDGGSLVFRRLTATGNGGRGTWDVLTVRVDGTGLAILASGAAWRGAPDWGPGGIVFPEQDQATGIPRLVLVQPDGSGRREVVSLAAGFELAAPRWLP